MKKSLSLMLLFFAIVGLAGCRKQCCRKKVIVEDCQEERVSGPCSDTDVPWRKEDYK